MIFRHLGRLVCWAWAPLIVAWAVLLLGTHLVAPPFNEVAQDREFAFLPADMPSRQAEEVFHKAFPDEQSSSNIVLVLSRDSAAPADRQRDLKFIDDVLESGLFQIAEDEGGLASQPDSSDEPLFSDEPASHKPEKRSIIARIRTPTAPGTGALLVSPDGRAMLVVLELTTELLASENWPTIDRVQQLVDDLRQQGKVPGGLDITVTGSAVIGRDHTLAQLQSVRATEWLTVALVIVLLVLIYRAPLLALIPLVTVFLAVQVSLNFLAILAQAGYITLFQGIQIYVIILAYGAGVDYCLFLTARYREELERGRSPRDAIPATIDSVGHTVAASAATVIAGIGMMMFASFGKFRQAGFAIPVSLLVVLIATLTFSPALLRLAGCWAFWPHQLSEACMARQASRAERPSYWLFRDSGFDWIWHRVADWVVRRPGTIWLASVGVLLPFAVVAGLFYHRLSYDLIGNLPATAPSVAGTRVLQEHFPAGIMGPVTVLLVDDHVDFSKEQGQKIVGRLTERLRAEKDDLGLADVRSLTAPLGITQAARELRRTEGSDKASREAVHRAVLERYVTSLGARNSIGTRLDLILTQSPFAQWSMDDLDRIESVLRDALVAEGLADAQLHMVGTTASVRDLSVVMHGDRRRIELLVLASVLVVLIVLLRAVVVPLYLLLSVLFSYLVTLGVAFVLFFLLDPAGFTGIDWKVAIFLFTILIAVGEDYNIFLMTRVHEEQRRFGPVRGIAEALIRTGPIISSCGIIMAGTFASLLAGSLTEMKQLGFALPFGVLLDTFVVRPILLPTFLLLLDRFRSSPRRQAIEAETGEPVAGVRT
jgi:RND superfamily putative drug exporter